MNNKDSSLYLHQINDSINLIKEYTKGFSENSFCEDHKTIDAVLMQIIVIGESCSRLNAIEYCQTHSSIPWSKIRGMRNLIAHDYARVDPIEVWNAVSIITSEFAEQIKSIF
jgi:uncharacterized protein with HEPN domain